MSRRSWTALGVVLVIAGSYMIAAAIDDRPPASGPDGQWADLGPDLGAPPAATHADSEV